MLGREHGVPQWLTEGYSLLVDALDQGKMTLEKIIPLGWETACKILWVGRERPESVEVSHCTRCLSRKRLAFWTCDEGGYAKRFPKCGDDEESRITHVLQEDSFRMNRLHAKSTGRIERITANIQKVFEEELKIAQLRDAGGSGSTQS